MFTETLTLAKPKGNGLACPRCSNELVNTAKLATGNRIEVVCLICDYASIYNTYTMKLEKNF